MATYFFVLIPPRLLTSKAPALWQSRTECDWEIWRSIFSQSTHLPWGGQHMIPPPSLLPFSFYSFFFCFFSGFTMNLWICAWKEELGSKLNQRYICISGAASWLALTRLVPEIPFSSVTVLMMQCKLKARHTIVLQPAQNDWTMSHIWALAEFSWQRKRNSLIPNELSFDQLQILKRTQIRLAFFSSSKTFKWCIYLVLFALICQLFVPMYGPCSHRYLEIYTLTGYMQSCPAVFV